MKLDYWGEAVVVGLVTMVLGTVISIISMYLQPNFSIKRINFWPSLLAVNFLIGFIFHILSEWVGTNKWYCTGGYSCRN